MRKKQTLTLVMLLVAVLLASCTKSDKQVSINLETLADSLLENIAFRDNLTQMDNALIEAIFFIGSDSIEESVIYMDSGATGEMFALFKLSEDADSDAVKGALDMYLSGVVSANEGYNAEAHALAQKGKIIVKGQYMLLGITPNQEAFEASIKKASQ